MCELPINHLLHAKQPDVTSDVRPETKPWPWVQDYFFYFDQDNNPTRISGIRFTKQAILINSLLIIFH